MVKKWSKMSGTERYQVVEIARKGEVSLKEICDTFGVTRQTLHKAMEQAEEAARSALEPKPRGRKGKSEEEKRLIEAEKQKAALKKETEEWKQKYEVAKAFLDLQRKQEETQKKPGRKKKKPKQPRDKRPWLAKVIPGPGTGQGMARGNDGRRAGDKETVTDKVESETDETS